MASTSRCAIFAASGISDRRAPGEGRQPFSLEWPSDPDDASGGARTPIALSAETGITAAQRHQFNIDFHRDLARLQTWAAKWHWPCPDVPEFRVVVSDRFKISKSLVPAWSGDAGRMEFPAWRVAARKAAIAHELVHVLFPNGNRLLAEGLAVHLQAELGGNPAFPNFGRPLHQLARERLHAMAGLGHRCLADLDSIATPAPLTLKVGDDFYGEEPRGQTHIYPIAGSFVRFLIETHGLDAFRDLYSRTPLISLQHNAGAPERWTGAYGMPLADLEMQWMSVIVRDDSAAHATLPNLNREHGHA